MDNYKSNLPVISNIYIINQKELLLYSENFNFTNESINIKSGSLACDPSTIAPQHILTANYDNDKGTFVIQNGELSLGVDYELSSNNLNVEEHLKSICIPTIIHITQTSPTQIKFVFDTPVDVKAACNPYNYWLHCNQDIPVGVATLGSRDYLTPTSVLKPFNCIIEPADSFNTIFTADFRVPITSGIEYMLIPSNIPYYGMTDYLGPNFVEKVTPTFIAK